MADVSETLIPNSDQLDAADLAASGPRIFTIERVVVRSGAEQPVDVHFAEFPRPWRPGRNMRRVLAHVYGKDSSKWVGHKVELYCDPDVVFGRETVGGSRISRMTGIDAPIKAPIIVGRGKRGTWPVKPLTAEAPPQRPPDDPMAVMGALMKKRGLTVKEDALAYVESIIGRAVASRDEMTPDEVTQVIKAMEQPIEDPA